MITAPSLFIYEAVRCIKRNDLTRNKDIHRYKTRNKGNRFLEVHRTKLFDGKPTCIGDKFLDKLPVEYCL